MYQDQALCFMMQDTIVDGKATLSKFWHKFQETNENLCQNGEEVFVKVGQNWTVIVIMMFWILTLLFEL